MIGEDDRCTMLSDRVPRRSVLKTAATALALATGGCLSAPTASESRQTSTEANSTETHRDSHGHNAQPTDHHGSETTGHREHDRQNSPSSSDGHHHGSGSTIGEPVEHAEVALVTKDGGYHFEPHIVRVKKGGRVTWTLESGSHSTTAYADANGKPQRIPENAKAWDSGIMSQQGKTFEHSFATEGVYDYFCAPHESLGMIGSVVVGTPEPNPKSQPGLKPPQDFLPEQAKQKIRTLNERVISALES